MTQPLLRVTDLWKSYPTSGGSFFAKERGPSLFHAVAGVSFELEEGRCLGVVGESGSGKSTLVRLLANLLRPTRGAIELEGRDIVARPRDPVARASVQLVFQDPTESLNPSFTVRRTLQEPLVRLKGVTGAAALDAGVRELADLVHLPIELLDRLPHQLSGGQKARLGIARAIAPEPRVLLLDEPTTALDVSVQAKILLLLAELRERFGMAQVMVTHDLGVVRLLCDSVVVMKGGRIVERGATGEVMRSPAHEYTRSLVEALPALPRAS
jgi:peptide/nickel transport system ATP-binding protein